MTEIHYYKLNSLPAVPEKGAVYFIPNGIGDDVDMYIVNKDGTAFIFVGRANGNPLTVAAGGVTGTANSLYFGNGSGVTFGYNSAASLITASVNPSAAGMTAGMSNLGNTAGNTGTVTNRLIFAGGNNITLSQQTGVGGNTIFIDGVTGAQTVQTQNVHNVSIGGTNTLGVLAEISSGTLILAGGNNITLSQVGNGISIIGGAGGGGTFVLSDSNGLVWGTNLSTVTGSYTVPTDYISTGQSTLFQHTSATSDITSNALNTSQSSLFQQTSQMSDYLGTAYTSHTHTAGLYMSSNTLYTSSGTADIASLSFRGEGIASVGYSAGEVVFSVPDAGGGFDSANFRADTLTQTAVDPGTGDVKWNNATQFSATEIYISDITDLGVDISSFLALVTPGTVLRIQRKGNADQYQKWLITGITDNTGWWTLQVTLLDFFGVGFSNNQQITLSIGSPSAGIAISAGGSSARLASLVFANSNSISFGLSGSTITASLDPSQQTWIDVNYGSFTANPVSVDGDGTWAGSNNGVAFQFATDTNGATLFGNVPSAIYSGNSSLFQHTSATSAITSNALNTSQSSLFQHTSATSAITSNALNTSQSSLFQHTSATSAITSNAVNTSAARIQAIVASDATYTSGSVTLRDLNGITWQSTTGQQIQITHGLQYTSNTSAITASALNTSQSSLFQHTSATSAITSNALNTSQSSLFQHTSATSAITSRAAGTGFTSATTAGTALVGTLNSAGLSVGVPTFITNALTTARASTDAVGLNTAQSNVTWTVNSSGISLDARGYAGTGTTFTGTNASASITNDSLGINMALSVGRDCITYDGFIPFQGKDMTLAAQQGSLLMYPMEFPDFKYDRIVIPIQNTNATNSTGTHTLSFWVGIYTRNVSTLSLLTSTSSQTTATQSGTVNNYSLFSGVRLFTIPMTSTFTAGNYWIGHIFRTTSGGTNGTYLLAYGSQGNSNFVGHFGSAHSTSIQFSQGMGVYNTTTAGLPNSILFSEIRGSDLAVLRPLLIQFVSSTY